MRIRASSTISHQPTFRNPGFSLKISALNEGSVLQGPDYGLFIPAMDRRRMSDILKMSIACSVDCLQQAGIDQPDAIIVGTSMGCSVHTKTFLDKIAASHGELIAPTAFIVSTHNTIAGQISMLLKTHGYNMTHTQNTLSFEQALIDAMLCMENGYKNILVGGGDEMEDTIYNMKARLNDENLHLTCGASFFILSDEDGGNDAIKLVDVESFGLTREPFADIKNFLGDHHLMAADIDLVLYSNSEEVKTIELVEYFGADKILNYQEFTGTYYTSSAMAMHYAIDKLQYGHLEKGKEKNHVLICNNLIPENLGLILLSQNIAGEID